MHLRVVVEQKSRLYSFAFGWLCLRIHQSSTKKGLCNALCCQIIHPAVVCLSKKSFGILKSKKIDVEHDSHASHIFPPFLSDLKRNCTQLLTPLSGKVFMPRGVISFLLSLTAFSLHASRLQVATEWIAPCEMFHKMDSEEPLFPLQSLLTLKRRCTHPLHHTRVKPRLAQAPQELGKNMPHFEIINLGLVFILCFARGAT